MDAQAPPRGLAAPIRWGQEFLLLASVVLMLAGADQWSKGWAVERLGPLAKDRAGRLRAPWEKPPVEVWEGYLRLNLTGNSGAIFGLGRTWPESVKRPLFLLMSFAAMAFIVLLVRGSQPEQRLRRLGLAAVLSGAVGNLIDRMRHDYVVDFIDWYGGFHWPTFNVADVAITGGVLLVLVDLWWHPDPAPAPVAAEVGLVSGEDGAPGDPASSGNPSP